MTKGGGRPLFCLDPYRSPWVAEMRNVFARKRENCVGMGVKGGELRGGNNRQKLRDAHPVCGKATRVLL